MERLKYIALITLLFLGVNGMSQGGVHSGMVRTQGTLSLGIPLSGSGLRYFVYGDAEVMVSDNVGLNGGVYIMLGSSLPYDRHSFVQLTDDNFRLHALFFGPNYHFLPNQPLDVFVGVQPGLQYSRIIYSLFQNSIDSRLNPAVSLNSGIAYYGSFFHIFAHMRAVFASHVSNGWSAPMSDLRLAVGLGFNFN